MELSQIRYFVTLSHTLNFTRAAEQNNVSQPALTRAIRRLEDDLGGRLLFRERSLTKLTELGRSILPHMQAIIESADSVTALASTRRNWSQSELKIGLGSGVSSHVIAPLIRIVVTIVPELMVEFVHGNSLQLAELMLHDEIDCALLPDDLTLPARITRLPLYRDRGSVILPRSHALANINDLSSADLSQETIVIADQCDWFARQLIENSARKHRQFRCRGSETHLLELVDAGLGVAILPERLNLPGTLTRCRLNQPILQRQIDLATISGRSHGPAVVGFVKLCRSQRL